MCLFRTTKPVTLRCTVLPFYLHRALVSQCTISIHTHCALVNRSTTHHTLPSRFCLLLCPQISLSTHSSTTSSLLHRALVSQCTILLTSLSPESLAIAQPNDFLFTTGFPVHDVKYTYTLLWLTGAQPHFPRDSAYFSVPRYSSPAIAQLNDFLFTSCIGFPVHDSAYFSVPRYSLSSHSPAPMITGMFFQSRPYPEQCLAVLICTTFHQLAFVHTFPVHDPFPNYT